jgi:sulfane dehydrogenase subunit SoxC
MVITGLAWTGRGKITRVDVSLDGGKNWQEARLAGEPQSMALTRFYSTMSGTARPRCCCSPAPSTRPGYVQPTKDQLREIRGLNSVYHNNGIQTWWVKPDGEAENVEVS